MSRTIDGDLEILMRICSVRVAAIGVAPTDSEGNFQQPLVEYVADRPLSRGLHSLVPSERPAGWAIAEIVEPSAPSEQLYSFGARDRARNGFLAGLLPSAAQLRSLRPGQVLVGEPTINDAAVISRDAFDAPAFCRRGDSTSW